MFDLDELKHFGKKKKKKGTTTKWRSKTAQAFHKPEEEEPQDAKEEGPKEDVTAIAPEVEVLTPDPPETPFSPRHSKLEQLTSTFTPAF